MTLLARDEEEVLAQNLAHHLEQGVDLIIVTENGSTDGTPGILADFSRKGRIQVIREPEHDYRQARWVTRMARLAAGEGADWVFHDDADEFWFAADPARSVRDVFAGLGPAVGALAVPRFNFLPSRDEEQAWWERLVMRDREPRNMSGKPLPPKIAHRAAPDVTVGDGAHRVEGIDASPIDGAPLEVLHFPMRSYEQFEQRTVMTARARRQNPESPPGAGRQKRKLLKLRREGRLPAFWEERLAVAESGSPQVVRDTRLRDELRRLEAGARAALSAQRDSPEIRSKASS